MDEKTVAVAGGSGFIGRAIVRRLAGIPATRVRLLTRDAERARHKFEAPANVEFVSTDVTNRDSLKPALAGASAVVNAVQFDGYPIENPRRGLTFERVDYGGTVALLDTAKNVGVSHFIYISGAAADENSSQPGFRAKGRAERAIRESGLSYTIFRPSLVYGAGDRVMSMLVNVLRLSPVMLVPGTGQQKVQPVLVDDVAACVALALGGRGRNGAFDVGGPALMTFDDLIRLVMDITGRRRLIIHVPEAVMRVAGAAAEMLPVALFSRDAASFLLADNAGDIKPLVGEFGIKLTPAREGLAYLAPKQ
jgi:NADH dehydrogenase